MTSVLSEAPDEDGSSGTYDRLFGKICMSYTMPDTGARMSRRVRRSLDYVAVLQVLVLESASPADEIASSLCNFRVLEF